MKIKHQNEPSKEFTQFFLDFCYRSKPYDFCNASSPNMRRLKILEYLVELQKGGEFFEVEEEGRLVFGAVFSVDISDNSVTLEFALGNNYFSNTKIIEGWWQILDAAFELWAISSIESEIQRTHKKSNFISWIKRYDTRCQINKNLVTWNK